MTQGSDLFSVSLSSRALHDTRSSTLETQAAGPLRLVAGEVASWMSFILARAEGSVQSAKTERGARPLEVPGWRDLSKDTARSQDLTWNRCHRENRGAR